MKNTEKIMEFLEKDPEKVFITGTLAEETKIPKSTIGRYLKELETDKKIIKKRIQNGKIRTVEIRLLQINEEYPIKTVSPKPERKIKKKQEIITSRKKINIFQENLIPDIIDNWDKIFKSSDAKRFIFLVKEGHTFRGKNIDLDIWLDKEFK